MRNRQWILASRPAGDVAERDFALIEGEMPRPDLSAGEFLIQNFLIGFDPAQRGWIEDVRSYMPPVQIGEVMRSTAMGRVICSQNPDFPEGSLVAGLLGWQEFALGSPASPIPLRRQPENADRAMVFGALGGAGLTAYFGLLEIGDPKPGDTVVVSSAAGAVGSVAAQIARLKGCRVIGIAGGPRKCAWLTDVAGLAAAIDYKRENLVDRLGALCPQGIDIYFDNVGGAMLEAAITHVAEHGRIVMCGAISGYNDAEPGPGPRNLMNIVTRRVKMQGFIASDYLPRMPDAKAELERWVNAGQIKVASDIQRGFENIPRTFLRLFNGENLGKQLLEF